ncbi:hypothetical protein MSG28_003761 [Choristoneura fumiferana]|uniref:Uncharacterized protein n=1 Tax=Choristoneura fumiferana TaxID=7141 RepID=A0ACC0KGQ5_CHOFU|nr:hypothetical protein MSG28_003761 [Choristoneura fumiferana]
MWPSFLRAAQVAPLKKFVQAVLAALALTSLQPQPRVPDGAVYDFIVVGAGTAGAIVATRLAEDPSQRVLLVEAGGPAPAQSEIPGLFPLIAGSEYDWQYEAYTALNVLRAQKGKVQLERGKLLGGCSSANYMLHALGSRADYGPWVAAAGPLWQWEHVWQHLKKFEAVQDQNILNSHYGHLRGMDGEVKVTRQVHRDYTLKYFQAIFEMGQKISHDYNSCPQPSFSEGQYTIFEGERQSTAATYLAAHHPNLDVLTHTRVSRVLFDENKVAVGVEALTKDGSKSTFRARKEVILSAGAINTPQILMLSGIGPKRHLEQFDIDVISDLPVGENLQDHILVPLLLTDDNTTRPDPTTIFEFPAPTIVGFAALNETQSQPDYEVMSYPLVRGSKVMLLMCSGFGLRDEICDRFDAAAAGNSTLLASIVLLHPESRGRVRLHSSDPTHPPSIYMGYYDNPVDLERHTAYTEHFLRILNTTHFKRVRSEVVNVELEECALEEFGSHEYWSCYARHMATTLFHPVGTAPLGAVLGPRLRVRGAACLRVVDAAAMPTLPSGNTNAPVALLAEHAALLIKQDYGIEH